MIKIKESRFPCLSCGGKENVLTVQIRQSEEVNFFTFDLCDRCQDKLNESYRLKLR